MQDSPALPLPSQTGLTRRSVLGGIAAAAIAPLASRAQALPQQALPTQAENPLPRSARALCHAEPIRVEAPPRMFHAMAALADGSLLVTGGVAFTQVPSAAAFLYFPASGEWRSVAPMNHPRAQHASVALGDGRVAVFGGKYVTASPLSTVEIYNPGLDTWTIVKSMPVPRYGHTAIAVGEGRALIVGGSYHRALSVAHTYDAFKDAWESDDVSGAAQSL